MYMEVAQNERKCDGILGTRRDFEFSNSKNTIWTVPIKDWVIEVRRRFLRRMWWPIDEEENYPLKRKPRFEFAISHKRREIVRIG